MSFDDQSVWTQKHATMSDKSARTEFGITQEVIINGIRSGKLQYREASAHGNPYLKLVRKEVENLVAKQYGASHLKTKAIENELKAINRELNSAKRKITMLEKRKAEIFSTQKIKKL